MTTPSGLAELLARVNDATAEIRSSEAVPASVFALMDSFDPSRYMPARTEADPYLVSTLFAAAFVADKALRQENDEHQRREVRIALEQFRHALRDIIEDSGVSDDTPVRDVLGQLAERVSVPQPDLAALLGVSTRQLQRWLTDTGSPPAGEAAARVRVVARLANQLRHSFTSPGVVAWFTRPHPTLKVKPIEWLDDPMRYPQLTRAATSTRAMTA